MKGVYFTNEDKKGLFFSPENIIFVRYCLLLSIENLCIDTGQRKGYILRYLALLNTAYSIVGPCTQSIFVTPPFSCDSIYLIQKTWKTYCILKGFIVS